MYGAASMCVCVGGGVTLDISLFMGLLLHVRVGGGRSEHALSNPRVVAGCDD